MGTEKNPIKGILDTKSTKKWGVKSMAARYCNMPERELPVICDADIIIAGATLGSISAALKAADMGAKVFVISYMPYMGEDICGTYKYLFEEQEGSHPLLAEIFPEDKDRTPFNVKKALENELVDRNVDFLYSSYVTDVLFNEEQQPAGVVIANRSGQQIIRGKVIIDATQGAYVAKMAGQVEEGDYCPYLPNAVKKHTPPTSIPSAVN